MATPKTIIFSFDGTGNEPSDSKSYMQDESISNILKLHILLGGGILDDHTETKTEGGGDQITYYYNGIGTRDGILSSIPLLGKLITKAQQYVNQGLSPTWGDARRILAEAMDDFNKSGYSKNNGDKLVVFGFSRGAALARKFVSMLLKEDNRTVDFLGVFDTVAAMNGIHRKGEEISSDVLFENGSLHDNVKRAVHIVSLDENRVPFTPTLINQNSEDDEKRILEIWFPGVHSDIGGGYWHDGLSDLALQFMIDQCRKALGASIHIEDGTQSSVVDNLVKRQKLKDEGIAVDDIIINGLEDGELHAHSGIMEKVGYLQPRTVYVSENDRPSAKPPLVHHTVRDRFNEVAEYRPPALRGLTFNLLLAKAVGGETKTIKGIAGLKPKKNIKVPNTVPPL